MEVVDVADVVVVVVVVVVSVEVGAVVMQCCYRDRPITNDGEVDQKNWYLRQYTSSCTSSYDGQTSEENRGL